MKFLLVLFWFTSIVFGQLDNFSVQISTTPETCPNNGSVTFQASNTTPNATLTFEIYALPNLSTPIVVLSGGNNSFQSLNSGNYQVKVIQTLGANSGFITQNFSIENQIQNIQFNISATRPTCIPNGSITVNVLSGNPVSYEIVSPIVVPPQSSPTFNNLGPGLYLVKVNDNCGNGFTQNFSLTTITPNLIISGMAELSQPDCNTKIVGHTLSSPTVIAFPVQLNITIQLPNGSTQNIQQTTSQNSFNFSLPAFYNVNYSYQIQATDACGIVYNINQNLLFAPNIQLTALPIDCNKQSLLVQINNGVAPYIIQFIQAPAGFNPILYQPNHPGPFTTDEVNYSNPTLSILPGNYTVQITDSCGATATNNIFVSDLTDTFDGQIEFIATSCSSFSLVGIRLQEIIMLQAPNNYPNSLPFNYTPQLNNGAIEITNLPPGSYTFYLVDNCNNSITLNISTPNISVGNPDFSLLNRPGCQIGYGSIRLTNPATFSQVVITSAPSNFNFPLPFSVNNLNSNTLYLSEYPAGDYSIQFINACGFPQNATFQIIGYQVTQNDIDITPLCGAFHLTLAHQSNGNFAQNFWLQKWNPNTQQWTHPQTGIAYPEGSSPNNSNSIPLVNNFTNLNFNFLGEFRVLKRFQILTTNGGLKDCFQTLNTFTFDGNFDIQVSPIVCNQNLDAFVEVIGGVAPYQYRILLKDGEPFVVDNGTNPWFNGLTTGLYRFEITDSCAQVRVFDIQLQPIALALSGNTEVCTNSNASITLNGNFPFLQYQWYKQDAPNNILSTSFQLNIPNFQPFQSGTYILEVTYPNASCGAQLLSFELTANSFQPLPGNGTTVAYCSPTNTISLWDLLEGNFQNNGVWTDANGNVVTDTNILLSALSLGNYSFTYTVSGNCNLSASTNVIIEIVNQPAAPILQVNQPICEGGQILLSAPMYTNATYIWNGPNNFESNEQNPIINNANNNMSGTYSLTVIQNQCVSDTSFINVNIQPQPSFVLQAPNYFCPGTNQEISVNGINFSNNEVVFSWFINQNLVSNSNELNFEITQSGVYELQIDWNGCITSQTIEILPLPNFQNPNPVQICQNNDVVVAIPYNADFTYQWIGPNGWESNDANLFIPQIQTSQQGVYQLSITYNQTCLVFETSVAIQVQALPIFEVNGNTTFCLNQSTFLSVNPENFDINNVQIQWFWNGNLVGNGQTIQASNYGNYETVVTISACSTSVFSEVIEKQSSFEVEILESCEQDQLVLRANITGSANNITYAWYGPNQFFSTEPFVIITGFAAGTYGLIITDEEGCTASNEIYLAKTLCVIPNYLSPNQDGLNDFWNLAGFDVQKVEIYNRWGRLVYEKENYTNEFTGVSIQGKNLPDGTYFYLITFLDQSQKQGWLQISVNSN